MNILQQNSTPLVTRSDAPTTKPSSVVDGEALRSAAETAATALSDPSIESVLVRMGVPATNRSATTRAERSQAEDAVRRYLGVADSSRIELDLNRARSASGAFFRDGGIGLFPDPQQRYLRGSVTVNEMVSLPAVRSALESTIQPITVDFIIPFPPDPKAPRFFVEGVEVDPGRAPDQKIVSAVARASLNALPPTGAARIDDRSVAMRFQDFERDGSSAFKVTVADCFVTSGAANCFSYMVSKVVDRTPAQSGSAEQTSRLRRWFLNPGRVQAPDIDITDTLQVSRSSVAVSRSVMSVRGAEKEPVELDPIRIIPMNTWDSAFVDPPVRAASPKLK
ncbi:MAG: hypothetical protein IT290_05490 [Deltaproteobacteria bacterium]|nr:hypothetical protein [Deltaproteobacteria bacterium]